MNEELKQLIEDAAKLLGLSNFEWGIFEGYQLVPKDQAHYRNASGCRTRFNPLDPERGDLMKVADAAELILDLESQTVELPVLGEIPYQMFHFAKGDYQSLALAVLRAASAVWKSRGEE